jgi:hypothetical protein
MSSPTLVESKKVADPSQFAVTLGLTALVIPLLRQATRSIKSSPIEFRSHRNLDLPFLSSSRPYISTAHSHPAFPTTSSSSSSSSSSSRQLAERQAAQARARRFNTREERYLYGSSPAKHRTSPSSDDDDDDDLAGLGGGSGGGGGGGDQGDPLIGLKALGIATAMVIGCAGLGVFAVAKLLGVRDVSPSRDWAVVRDRRGGCLWMR